MEGINFLHRKAFEKSVFHHVLSAGPALFTRLENQNHFTSEISLRSKFLGGAQKVLPHDRRDRRHALRLRLEKRGHGWTILLKAARRYPPSGRLKLLPEVFRK